MKVAILRMQILAALMFLLAFGFSNFAHAAGCTSEVAIEGAISTATYDFVERAIRRSVRESCSSILFTINTPGGSLQTTRMIVEKILSSPIPVLCLVGPEGAHAGSAGALIMLACHVSGVSGVVADGANGSPCNRRAMHCRTTCR